MLESMTSKPRPTRAEVSDVANAVLDGADCIMLSGETAKGSYPVECVRMMHAIAREAEAAIFHRQLFDNLRSGLFSGFGDSLTAVCISAVEASFHSLSTAIICLTTNGQTVHMLSKYRPRCPIIGVTRNEVTARQMHLWRGCYPIIIREPKLHTDVVQGDLWLQDVDFRIQKALDTIKLAGFTQTGDNLVVVTGWRGGSGFTNTIRIIKCP
jgi:pyruvate kinase